jgi:Glycosyl transferase family 1
MRSIVFYISGHGYGHAVRMSEVIAALQRLRPNWHIVVRSQAPAQMMPEGVEFFNTEIDSGVVERLAGVVMDEDATVVQLRNFLGRWDDLVSFETSFVKEHGVGLIVADIPPIAGDIAHLAGIPCIGISNFTWDWIYEPYASQYLGKLERGYARMSALLRLPFFQPTRLDAFPSIVDTPLIARKSPHRPAEARKRVLLGSRAEVSAEVLARAAREAPEFELVAPGSGSKFTEEFAACDMVIAKLGFSMLAECIAAGKPILYPPRQGFREEILLQEHVNHHVAAVAIPLEDFYGGNWGPHLRKLAALPTVASGIRCDGAEFCARFLAHYGS